MNTINSFINKNNVKIEYDYAYIDEKHYVCRGEYSIMLPRGYHDIDDMGLGLKDIDMYNEDEVKELKEKLEDLSKEYHILEVGYSEHSNFSFHVYRIKDLKEINFLDLQGLVFYLKSEYSDEEVFEEAEKDIDDFNYRFNGRFLEVYIHRPIQCKNLETNENFYIYEYSESQGYYKSEDEIHKKFDDYQIKI